MFESSEIGMFCGDELFTGLVLDTLLNIEGVEEVEGVEGGCERNSGEGGDDSLMDFEDDEDEVREKVGGFGDGEERAAFERPEAQGKVGKGDEGLDDGEAERIAYEKSEVVYGALVDAVRISVEDGK